MNEKKRCLLQRLGEKRDSSPSTLAHKIIHCKTLAPLGPSALAPGSNGELLDALVQVSPQTPILQGFIKNEVFEFPAFF